MTDREKLIELLNEATEKMDCPQMHELADYLIASGVVIREKGEWDGTYCTRCGGSYMDYADSDSYPAMGEPRPDFCPNCGADMRGENNG